MDWADDIAYSVHDVEDGLHAGLVPFSALFSADERSQIATVALSSYCRPAWAASVAELETVFAEFMALPCWQFSFDGGPEALAAVKNLTSELVGRFCEAAERATLLAWEESGPGGDAGRGAGDVAGASGVTGFGGAASDVGKAERAGLPGGAGAAGGAGMARDGGVAGPVRLLRYAVDLVVPRRQLLECALLKAVALRYVMRREGAAAQQAGEREVIAELAMAIYQGAPATLDPVLRPSWAAADAAGCAAPESVRRRAVIDQVASLTDRSAIVWHRRLCS